jgi:ferredoxin
MGCGICAAECPACAIQLHHFETEQFEVMIKALLAGDPGDNDERNVATQQQGNRLARKI